MIITGIIGYPLDMTLSPRMHKAAFEAKNINGVYLEIPVEPARIKEVLDSLRVIGCRGVNVTNPHKETLLLFLTKLSEEAKMAGAVNTIVFDNDDLIGYNTDIFGLETLLHNLKIELHERNILLIGAGGAGRAAAYVIRSLNPKTFYIANRNFQKARQLAQQFDATAINISKLHSPLLTTDMVISATSVDLQDDVTPFMQRGSLYVDLNYKFPHKKRDGITMVNGLEMLVQQGARSFSLWTGEEAPVDVMKKALGLNHD
ncbi:MAG: shikimate dehydrogenase [Candidatus Marinimicrobia bacterium]|nr:shikimate dehydrogenase [Candidatus Neomarinimicrobiota bacterium]